MRILRIADIADNKTGGMSRAMYGTGDALAAAGHVVNYMFNSHLTALGPATVRRFMVPLKIPFLVRHLMHQGEHYDVVEVHEPLAAAYCFLRPLMRSLPPVVIFSHGLEERGRIAELAYRKQKGLPISLKKRYSPLSVVMQAVYAIRHCSQVICTNSEDVGYLIERGVSENCLTRIQNGVEGELLEAGESLAQEDGQRSGLLFIGSWLVRKGVLDLVPAVTQVLRRHPETCFTVAGSGIGPEAVKQAFSKDVHKQINVVPTFSSNETLIDLYRRHSVFILPSYFEGQPLVMIEAAAFGMAIVTTSICGMADFIKDGQNGLLVKVGDSKALEIKMENLIKDSRFARQLGEAARITAHEHTWAKSAQLTLQAYERAIHNTSGAKARGTKNLASL